jgi:hypothetical protein
LNARTHRVDGFLFLAEGDKRKILEDELAAAHRPDSLK